MKWTEKIALKNPLKNGFFLLALWSFALAMLTQRLGRSLTLNAIQQQLVYELPANQIQQAGFSQDISVAAYYSLLVLLCALLPYRKPIIQTIQFLFIVTQGVLVAIDIHLLQTWNSRFNQLAIHMLQFPEATLQSLSTSQRWMALVFILLLLCIAILKSKALTVLLNKQQPQFKPSILILFAAIPLLIAARGSVKKIPLNTAAAHFSADPLQNNIATNPNWNLIALYQQPTLQQRTNRALMNHGVEDFAINAYTGPDSFPGGLKRMPQIIRRGSNVLFVVLEGINQHWLESKQTIAQSSKYVDGLHSDIQQNWDPQLTAMPNLVKLAQDGMWYKKAYATGDRTDKGLASIFTAWPSQPWQGLLFQPSKWTLISQQKLPARFHEAGYSTSFLYGGDPAFANMGSFLKFVGFQQIITPNQNSVSDWGMPDKAMVPKVLQHLKSAKKPFFSAWLTLSSHEPYDVVTDKGLTQAQQLRKSIEYTDQAIGQLVAGLKAANLYDSTVIVFVSDHGKTVGLPVTEDYEQEFFRIPIIITGGPMRDMYRGVAPYLIVSQTDIYATLAEQLLENVPNVPFSRNMYFANHPGMALSFTEGKAVLAATGYRHHLFLDHFDQKTASDSIVLGLQSKIIRTFFSK